MAEDEKSKETAAEVPEGIRELMDEPAKQEGSPEASAGEKEKAPERPRTQKEQELDALIAKRQGILEQLKAKNPLVAEARKQLSGLMPSVRGRGSSRAMELMREEERLEFSIATEAYTPKKEKELLTRMRAIRSELSAHKELDAARKAVDEKRAALRTLLSEVKSLERELAEARKACDEKYAEVLAERRSQYEQRQHARQARRQKEEGEVRHRAREGRKREYEDEVAKYTKDYDDTVSMDEIVQIEKKEKKKKEE